MDASPSGADQLIPPLIDEASWKALAATARFVFLDGASASGKSTMKNALQRDPAFHFSYARRYTTRAPRAGDSESDDYIFISMDRFLGLKDAGDLIEFRQFLFGMSYGIGKSSLAAAARKSSQVFSVMNLGRVADVRDALPRALCVLIDAPLDSIERRLRERQVNSEEQIAERLGNARSVKLIRDQYDFVLDNEDGGFDAAYGRLASFLRKAGLS